MSNKPSHVALQGITTKKPNPDNGSNIIYNRIGSGWTVENKPGYISVKLNSLPVDGELLICPNKDAE